MSYLTNAQKLRTAIDDVGAMLTDEQALTVPLIYPAWSGDSVSYTISSRVMYGGILYKCYRHTLHRLHGHRQTHRAFGLKC